MLTRILVGFLGMVLGVLMVVFARKVVEIIGTSATAERYLGGGGTYTALRIGGILAILIFFLYMIGFLGQVIQSIGRAIFGG